MTRPDGIDACAGQGMQIDGKKLAQFNQAVQADQVGSWFGGMAAWNAWT